MDEQLLSVGDLDRAAALLLRGGILAFPTDTVYGLGAHPAFPDALNRLFEAKLRPLDKAIPLLLADARDLVRVCGNISESAGLLAKRFWPGALTLIVARRTPSPGESPTVAVRVPALELARTLLRASGGALAVTSANLSGRPSCTTAAEVLSQLGGRIDAILDGGPCPGGVESTIVDTTVQPCRVLRLGGLPRISLEQVVALEP